MCIFDCTFYVILTLISLFDCLSGTAVRRHGIMSEETVNAMVEDHCNKFKSDCPRDPSWMGKVEKICGFDDVEYELAEFDELCTLHQMDCQMHRVFRPIDMEVCDARKVFDEQYPAQASDYTKKGRSTVPGSTVFWRPPTPFKHNNNKKKPTRWRIVTPKTTANDLLVGIPTSREKKMKNLLIDKITKR